jgi:hypothetical protein
MRITREMLLNLARETAERTARRQRDVVCIFLIGSLLDDEPLLGGSGDIDLVYVHDSEPLTPREIQRLSDEITLDIAHLGAAAFQPARRLRQDPWLGSALWYNPLVLYDRQHWFEFTQAGATAHFTLPENVYPRSQRLATTARQLWRDLSETPSPALETAWGVLEALTLAANAIACLSGAPLTERRFVLNFPARAQAVGRPGLAAGFTDLIGGEAAAHAGLQDWQAAWLEALDAVGAREDAPPRLNAARRATPGRVVDSVAHLDTCCASPGGSLALLRRLAHSRRSARLGLEPARAYSGRAGCLPGYGRRNARSMGRRKRRAHVARRYSNLQLLARPSPVGGRRAF